jgi:hypothetical protein
MSPRARPARRTRPRAGQIQLVGTARRRDNASVSDDFFTTHRANLAAIEAALTALTTMRDEFEQRGSGSEHWFYDLTCTVVFHNYVLHRLVASLEGEKTPWQVRVEARLLAIHTLETIDALGTLLNRTLDKRVADITDNPRIVGPLDEAAKDFATFRRINDKAIRGLRKALGIEEGRARERVAFDKDLDHQAVIALAIGVISWLSAFGRAATLLISAIRSDKQGDGAAEPEAGG